VRVLGGWWVGWLVVGRLGWLVGWLGAWLVGRLPGWSIGRLVGAMVVTIATSCTPTNHATRQGANTSKARSAGSFSVAYTFVAETQEDGPTQPVQGACDAPPDGSEGTESDDSHDLLASTSETERQDDGDSSSTENEAGNGSSSPENEWQDYGDSQGYWNKGVYHRYQPMGVGSDDDEESQVGEQFRDNNGDVWNVDYMVSKEDGTWQIHNQATSQVDEATTSQLEQWDRVDPEESSSSEEEGQWISGLRIWFGGWLAVRRRAG